jgi:hypothetical protein
VFRKKRRVFRRKRRVRRRVRRTPKSGLVSTKFCLDGTILVTGGTGGYYASASSLEDFKSASTTVTSYANLYQQYRIRKLKYDFYPRGVGNTITWADNAPHGGRAVTVLDFEDVTLPTSFNHLERSAYARKHTLNRSFSRYFTPCVNFGVEGNPLTPTTPIVAAAPRRSPWLKTSQLTTEHYGIKVGLTAPGPNTVKYNVDVCITGYVQFRFPQ